MLPYIQTFLYEATTYYLAVGFVVFRFHKMPQQPTTLVPAVVPLGDIEWCYTGETDSLLQIPEIEVPRCKSGETPRFYVYKFRSTGQYTSVDSCGVLSRLTQNYRRLVHARDYDLIIRNENLRKTFFIEQAVRSNVDVLTQGSKAAEYGELQAIMDYTRGHRATTHSAIPPTQNEEVKQGILVPVVWWCGAAGNTDCAMFCSVDFQHLCRVDTLVFCFVLPRINTRRRQQPRKSNSSCCQPIHRLATSPCRLAPSTCNSTRQNTKTRSVRFCIPLLAEVGVVGAVGVATTQQRQLVARPGRRAAVAAVQLVHRARSPWW